MDIHEVDHISGNDEYFITCIGFEDRCLGVINNFDNYTFSKSFILKYESVVDVPSAINNETKAHTKLSNMGGTVTEIKINPMNPIPALQKLFSVIMSKNVKMTIDISSMSKYVLLLLLRFLTEEKIIHNVRFLYTEPQNYVDDNKTPLSFGTSKFEAVPSFEGEHNGRSDRLLILMLGFEGKRAYSVWDRLEPDQCVLTIPSPPFNSDWGDRTRNENSALINAVGDQHVREIDSRNPESVLDSLNGILSDYNPDNTMNTMVIPLGTKPQTIGTFLFYWKNNRSPTIMYTNPKKHSDISKGVGRINEFTLSNMY